MSKPFIESVSWSDVVDHEQSLVPAGGLMTPDLQMKTAFKHFAALRKAYHDNGQTGKLGNAAADERRTG